ncbi:MAG: pyridoxamine 5'-phosphate oxidase [Pseudomonadota bacterium]
MGDDFAGCDPLATALLWLDEAAKTEPNDPGAMALATVDGDNRPSIRMVLLKECSQEGFVFYTNLKSRKGGDLAHNPSAALLFHWKSLRRQIRIEGQVRPVSLARADAYFATRPRGSQIGAWASAQSSPLSSRACFEQAVQRVKRRFDQADVTRPPWWSGFCLVPGAMEFWQDGKDRLHDRFRFDLAGDGSWKAQRLAP